MIAFESEVLKPVKLEKDLSLSPGDTVTITPSLKKQGKVNVWLGSAIYLDVDGKNFSLKRIISGS